MFVQPIFIAVLSISFHYLVIRSGYLLSMLTIYSIFYVILDIAGSEMRTIISFYDCSGVIGDVVIVGFLVIVDRTPLLLIIIVGIEVICGVIVIGNSILEYVIIFGYTRFIVDALLIDTVLFVAYNALVAADTAKVAALLIDTARVVAVFVIVVVPLIYTARVVTVFVIVVADTAISVVPLTYTAIFATDTIILVADTPKFSAYNANNALIPPDTIFPFSVA